MSETLNDPTPTPDGQSEYALAARKLELAVADMTAAITGLLTSMGQTAEHYGALFSHRHPGARVEDNDNKTTA